MLLIQRPRLLPLPHPLKRRPAQQPQDTDNEGPHNDLVLVAVTLEAHGRDVLLLDILTNVQVAAETEGFGALGARGGAAAGDALLGADVDAGGGGVQEVAEEQGGWCIGVEGDDGAVLGACAFAEGWRGWRKVNQRGVEGREGRHCVQAAEARPSSALRRSSTRCIRAMVGGRRCVVVFGDTGRLASTACEGWEQ